MKMNAVLPPNYTADAVPEERTLDEEQMPPAAIQANEMLRRVEEQAKSGNEPRKAEGKGDGSASAEPPDQPEVQKAKEESKRTRTKSNSKSDKKSHSSRKDSHTKVEVYNISGTGFHVGPNIEIHNNFVAGASSSRNKSHDVPPRNRDVNIHPELPRKLFKSLQTVTKEDCIHVSEYSSCKWEELGELLFFEEASRLEQYRAEMERNSRKKAVQLILEEWRKFAGTNALVARLSRELFKLDEIEALKRLAKRHNLN